MKVYRIKHNVSLYQYFLPQQEKDWLKLEMDCTPKASIWSPPPVYILEPKLKAGDFYNFGSSVLIASPLATQILRTYFEMAGELLPLPYNGQEFTVLNVIECINCLDQDNTEWHYDTKNNIKIRPKNYIFHSNRFTGSIIFKIPETCKGEILVVEGLDNCEGSNEFRVAIEQANLKGLIFEEIWSSLD